MSEQFYEVLKGRKYVGKHRVYFEGQQFPQSELFGTEDGGLDLVLNGRKAAKEVKDKEGKIVSFATKEIPPRIKKIAGDEIKKAVKK